MKVLVTGGDGMLGSNLVRLLLDKGYDVSIFTHPSSKSKTLDGLNVKKYTGDVLQPETMEEAFSQTDMVVHAAASTSTWPARSEMVNKINITGTENVIEQVLKHKINRMVYVGSGSSVNTKETDSNSKYPFPGAKFGMDYIDSKFYALNKVMAAVKEKNLPAIAVLPTFMLGAYDSLPGSGRMILEVAKGKLKFYSSGGRNFVYVKDVATAIVNALEIGTIGKYYITGGENLSYLEFLKKVAPIVGQPIPKIKTPNWIVKPVGFLMSSFGKLFKFTPLITYEMARISCENQFVVTDEAITELKMPQTNIETAITDCYNWFKENGYLDK